MPSLPNKGIYVAIDTSIFENENFNFNSHNMQILKQYIVDGNIKGLLIPDIVIGESHKHFRKRLITANERINGVINSRELKPFTATKSLSKYIKAIDIDKLAREMDQLMDAFLRDTNAVILKTDKIKLKDILNDYYNSIPPFGTGKKEHEFRDAIMVRRIKEVIELGDIAVVSSDGDWSSALGTDNRFRFYKSLSELFTSITKGQELSAKAQEYYLSHTDQINNEIEERLYAIPIFVDGYQYDRKGIVGGRDYLGYDVQNVSVISKTLGIDYVGEDKVIARLYVQANFEIDCTYRDESNSFWDSEEKDYIYEETGVVVEDHCLTIEVAVTYGVENDDIVECENVEFAIRGNKLSFGEDTLTERVARNNEGFYSCKRGFVCPTCGHKIKIDLMDYADSSCISDERGMGSEIEHTISCEDVCPRCGRHFEISGAVYEYPIGAFNFDGTKVKWK